MRWTRVRAARTPAWDSPAATCTPTLLFPRVLGRGRGVGGAGGATATWAGGGAGGGLKSAGGGPAGAGRGALSLGLGAGGATTTCILGGSPERSDGRSNGLTGSTGGEAWATDVGGVGAVRCASVGGAGGRGVA